MTFHFDTQPRVLLISAALCLALSGICYADACSDDTSCEFNTCRTPARPAPSSLWGEIQPAEASIPANRDTTDFAGFTKFNAANPLWMSLDVEGGFIFTAINSGFEIWDARSSPSSPVRLTQVDGREGQFPRFPANPEEKYPVQDIDSPDGDNNVVAVVGRASTGISIWNTTIKDLPRAYYQDYGENKDGVAVYAASVAGRQYAFMASETAGLLRYDITAAKSLPSTCTEQSPATQCSGVYQGKVGSRTNVSYVTGAGNLLALSSGVSPRGVEIWNLSASSSPMLAISALTTEIVFGVAMWQQGASYYLAVRGNAGQQLRIYDVTCAATASCSSLGSPLATVSTPDPSNSRYFVTASFSGATPFLYLGSDRTCMGSERREWLFDVSNPFAPRDATPPNGFYNGVSTGYWNWYYRATPTGFNSVGPRKARFAGEYLFRAAFSIFDIHRRGGGSALPNFTWSPTEVYPGTPVSFFDQSGGSPTSWSWTFGDGTPASSTLQNPSGVVFSTTGSKSISLQACNANGCNTTGKTLQVVSAAASVSSVSLSSSSIAVCNTITATANGVTGQAPLTILWAIRDSGGTIVASCSSNPCSWTPGTAVSSGNYTATVTVSNAANPSGASASAGFSVVNEPLSFPAGAPTNDPISGLTVKFHVQTKGATEWAWDFDDDGNPATLNFGAFSSDPVNGPNPTHTYSSTGQKSVRVRIRNCGGTTLDSGPLVINVTGSTTLTAAFQAQGCQFGVCNFQVNQAITFTDYSSGSPERWTYDWTNTGTTSAGCTFVGLGTTTPQASHTYTSEGTFYPCLRVTRGAATDVYVHPPIKVGSGGTTSLSIVGPSSGQPGQALTFSASASNCNASASGWTWTTDGGTGSSTTNTITVTWSTTGTKTLKVKNSACGTAEASRSVAISTTTGGTLVASFTYAPTTISAGQSVTFNASSSQGSPTAYTWEWGDGTPPSEGLVVTHKFAEAGTYPVKLTVAKPGEGTGCALGFCYDDETVQVTVQAAVQGSCVSDPTNLCLNNNRFGVKVEWETPDGTTGVGHPVQITNDTGYFWFFEMTNVEVVVKALDGCGVNGHFWVFSAGLTNVEATMTVTDTVTGEVQSYVNPQGAAYLPIQDTAAYGCSSGKTNAELFPGEGDNEEWLEISEGARTPVDRRYVVSGMATAAEATCTPSSTALCLNNGRFRVEATWKTPDEQTGSAQGVMLTGDTGYFWFFDSANVEIILKVLNGCQLNSRYWIFAGGLTNVEVSVRVTDTAVGAYKTYVNPQGIAFAPIQDTAALPFCP
jgi:PKD repeat protein